MSDKQLALNILKNIDDDKTFEEIIEILYMGLQIKKGIKDYEEGQTMTLEEVRNYIDNC